MLYTETIVQKQECRLHHLLISVKLLLSTDLNNKKKLKKALIIKSKLAVRVKIIQYFLSSLFNYHSLCQILTI